MKLRNINPLPGRVIIASGRRASITPTFSYVFSPNTYNLADTGSVVITLLTDDPGNPTDYLTLESGMNFNFGSESFTPPNIWHVSIAVNYGATFPSTKLVTAPNNATASLIRLGCGGVGGTPTIGGNPPGSYFTSHASASALTASMTSTLCVNSPLLGCNNATPILTQPTLVGKVVTGGSLQNNFTVEDIGTAFQVTLDDGIHGLFVWNYVIAS